MEGDYSDCIKRRIDCSYHSNKLRTHFLHPKLVLVCENKILVIDSETLGEDVQNDFVYEIENVVDTMLQERLLWVVVSSGEVSVIDVLGGAHVKIELINYTSYKVRELLMNHCNLYFISESEELLACTYSAKEIVDKMAGGTLVLQIVVEKVRPCIISSSMRSSSTHADGLNIFIEGCSLLTECPVTGFREIISSAPGLELQHILAWNDSLVLANDSNMWIINICNDKVILEFKTDGVKYYPVGEYQDTFYYLILNGTEVC